MLAAASNGSADCSAANRARSAAAQARNGEALVLGNVAAADSVGNTQSRRQVPGIDFVNLNDAIIGSFGGVSSSGVAEWKIYIRIARRICWTQTAVLEESDIRDKQSLVIVRESDSEGITSDLGRSYYRVKIIRVSDVALIVHSRGDFRRIHDQYLEAALIGNV